MHETVRDFYDELAGDYHLLFEHWEDSITRQAAVLGPILERRCGPAPGVTVLDCACGIGTQALGLARLSFDIAGSDISARAIERARIEAAVRGLSVSFHAADMRHLDSIPESGFDAVICMDNALPHLFSKGDLSEAAAQVHNKLRDGGAFVASIRDYDRLIIERPSVQGPDLFGAGEQRRIVFQLWDWQDERRYTFHLYITRHSPGGWITHHGASEYRALLREELADILRAEDFVDIEWMFPQDTGFYQPIVLATKQGKTGGREFSRN